MFCHCCLFFCLFLYCTCGTFSVNMKLRKGFFSPHEIQQNRIILSSPLWDFPHNVQQWKGLFSYLISDRTMMGISGPARVNIQHNSKELRKEQMCIAELRSPPQKETRRRNCKQEKEQKEKRTWHKQARAREKITTNEQPIQQSHRHRDGKRNPIR